MTAHTITRSDVVERSSLLPGFPRVVSEILATLDDPDSSTETLAHHVEHDPVIAGRLLSLANTAGMRPRSRVGIRDIYTAISLLGTNRVREMALVSSIAGFVDDIGAGGISPTFWQHSIAVGVCCQELAQHTAAPTSATTALIGGLLHDIGQLWLYRFDPAGYRANWGTALEHEIGIEEAERERFAVDHSIIGGWLAEHWCLPADIVSGIRHHHAPDAALTEPLVPLLHVAEVLSNALDLTGRKENRVTAISAPACTRLGLVWDASVRPLFGCMEARTRHAMAVFV